MKWESVKYIFKYYPKWIVGLISFGGVISFVFEDPIRQFINGDKVDFANINIPRIVLIVCIILMLGFIWAAIKSIEGLISKKGDCIEKAAKPQQVKKHLPRSEVKIGEYNVDFLCVDILATIDLDETQQPDVTFFLNRIKFGEPYCVNCHSPLDIRCANWNLGLHQFGYDCKKCELKIDINNDIILRELKSIIRTNYGQYWQKYQEEINKLTGGKPDDFEVPHALGIYHTTRTG